MVGSIFSAPAFPEIALPFLTSSISSALGNMASCLATLPASSLGAFPGVGAHAGNRVGHMNSTLPSNAGQSPPFTTDSLRDWGDLDQVPHGKPLCWAWEQVE